MTDRDQILSGFSRTEWRLYLARGFGIPISLDRWTRDRARSVLEEMQVRPVYREERWTRAVGLARRESEAA